MKISGINFRARDVSHGVAACSAYRGAIESEGRRVKVAARMNASLQWFLGNREAGAVTVRSLRRLDSKQAPRGGSGVEFPIVRLVESCLDRSGSGQSGDGGLPAGEGKPLELSVGRSF